jgi:3-deoxy-manno-octulosonate cytidylyltransferase (CMP-KDO synthetase)
MQRKRRQVILGVIPARLDSTRLPGKVLRLICGQPMLHHVFARAGQCELLEDLVVATDSKEVHEYCERHRMKVIMTSRSHTSGTERVHEVKETIPADIYVNIQGDEPMIRPEHLRALLDPFMEGEPVQVTTLKTPIGFEDAQSPHNVKVVTDTNDNALYFSRYAIPYRRDPVPGTTRHFKHLGMYAYTRSALERFYKLPPSRLEQAEKLEQLRFLEHGIPIHVAETPYDTIGVDTEEDLLRVEDHFQRLAAPERS